MFVCTYTVPIKWMFIVYTVPYYIVHTVSQVVCMFVPNTVKCWHYVPCHMFACTLHVSLLCLRVLVQCDGVPREDQGYRLQGTGIRTSGGQNWRRGMVPTPLPLSSLTYPPSSFPTPSLPPSLPPPQVTIVNPLNITKEFSSILANPIIATNVRTKIVLHGQL